MKWWRRRDKPPVVMDRRASDAPQSVEAQRERERQHRLDVLLDLFADDIDDEIAARTGGGVGPLPVGRLGDGDGDVQVDDLIADIFELRERRGDESGA